MCAPHEIFEREGEHLSCEVPVSFVTAALGGTVIVPTLGWSGVAEDSRRDAVGQGLPPARQGREAGARRRAAAICSASVMVETPVKLSGEQKEMLTKFEASLKSDDGRHSPREEGFFEGVKRFFTGAEH